ncbi:hypothetical protein Q5P01_018741 [Channa striata]|uniref:Uncharacterized protein n=1 Tax=Channa striata TaxID=64152 RepID=A0AA88S8R6_CHASR|nr:hypothetical protein Q5P01_018741 [Channa striata]
MTLISVLIWTLLCCCFTESRGQVTVTQPGAIMKEDIVDDGEDKEAEVADVQYLQLNAAHVDKKDLVEKRDCPSGKKQCPYWSATCWTTRSRFHNMVKPDIDDMLGREVAFDILFHISEHQATLFRYGVKNFEQMERSFKHVMSALNKLRRSCCENCDTFSYHGNQRRTLLLS